MKFKKPFDKECKQCGKTFKARTNGKLYCGLPCLNTAWYQRNKYRLGEERVAKKLTVI